jgi:Tol biopolymer transport system component
MTIARIDHIAEYPLWGHDMKSIFKSTWTRAVAVFLVILSMGGCATMHTTAIKDEISELGFSHDGKKILFDRCREGDCRIQVYDLATGELSAYQSPAHERWTMAKYSYDGKKIVFAIIPIKGDYLELSDMQIAVMDPDGKNLKKITTGPGAKIYPVFSHSGAKVLYARAAYIRKRGATPAAQFDAWEADITTGKEKRLTYFKFFRMSNLTYFPDDKQFICSASGPELFPGVREGDWKEIQKKQSEWAKEYKANTIFVFREGQTTRDKPYVIVDEDYHNSSKSPLLSRDGSRLLFGSRSTYYLYSPDGKHRRVGGGGSVDSAAISPDGELLGVGYGSSINIYRVQDAKHQIELYFPRAVYIENWDNDIRKYPRNMKMIPKLPSHFING